jgi:tRNA threonylcarbamoyladenosine biosynthesis protein TsaB
VRVLAIDSSSRGRLVVAIAGEDGALVDGRVVTGTSLDAALPAVLRELIRPAPGAVMAVTGPGSYTGVRAGMAAALGIAQALAIPLHGAGALQVVAFGAPASADEVLSIADAGRGGVHLARHRRDAGGWRPLEPPRRAALAELRLGEGSVAVTLDDPPQPGAVGGDHLGALAAATRQALASPPLGLAGLHAQYVEPPVGGGGKEVRQV